MGNEITLSYIQEMVRRREGRLGEKQQLLHLMRATGDLAWARSPMARIRRSSSCT